MDELGLEPGSKKTESKVKRDKNTKARDPLTARQRKLAEELGLLKAIKAGELLTYDHVELNEDSLIVKLRRQQDAMGLTYA